MRSGLFERAGLHLGKKLVWVSLRCSSFTRTGTNGLYLITIFLCDLLLVLNALKTLTFFGRSVPLYGATPLLGDGDRQLG